MKHMKRCILIGFILLFLVVLVAPSWASDLCADFTGAGMWKWNGTTWSQVTPNNPQFMSATGSLLYGSFAGNGIWKWNGTTWSQVTQNNPQLMAAAGSLLYGNFGTGAGIWEYDGSSWSQITPNSPTAMAATGSLLYGSFAGYGIWEWNGTTWNQVTQNNPQLMAAAGSLLYGSFGTGAGIWKYDGSSWSQITANSPTDMAAAGSLLYGNFGQGAGIWKYDGSSWSQVTPNAPTVMAAEGSLLYGAFAGAGIWEYDGSTWSQVTPNNPINMVFWSTPVLGAADYFPLNIGDWQDYKKSGTESIVRSTVTGPRYINGVVTKERNYWDGTKEYYTSDVNGIKLYGQYVISANFTGDIYFNTPLLLMPNNAQLGTTQVSGSSYTFSVQGYVFHVNITSTTTVLNFEDVQMANMILRDCVKVSIRIDQYVVETSQSFSSTVYYWFYKGVGCVKQQVDSTTYTITGSYVNGVPQTY